MSSPKVHGRNKDEELGQAVSQILPSSILRQSPRGLKSKRNGEGASSPLHHRHNKLPSPRKLSWTQRASPNKTLGRELYYEHLALSNSGDTTDYEEITFGNENQSPCGHLSTNAVLTTNEVSPQRPKRSKPQRPNFSFANLRRKWNQSDNAIVSEKNFESDPCEKVVPSLQGNFQLRSPRRGPKPPLQAKSSSFQRIPGRRTSKNENNGYNKCRGENMRVGIDRGNCATDSFQQNFHSYCGTISTVDDVLRAINYLSTNELCATICDQNGRSPLHIISSNKTLAAVLGSSKDLDFEGEEYLKISGQPSFDPESNLEKHVLSLLIELLAANPKAMVKRDIEGYFPFEHALVEWVHESFPLRRSDDSDAVHPSTFSYSNALGQVWESTMRIAGRTSMLVSGSLIPGSNDHSDDEESASAILSPERGIHLKTEQKTKLDDEGGDSEFEAQVRLTPQARFALKMLSSMVNTIDHLLSPVSSSGDCLEISKETSIRLKQSLQELRRQLGSVDIVTTVVQSIASLQDLMKTIILIDNDDDRSFALSTSIVRRVMLNKESVGPWLTEVLQTRDRRHIQSAVHYLKEVSSELSRKQSEALDKDDKLDHCDFENNGLVEAFSRLQDFLPSLLALSEKRIEDASTTLVVKRVLDRMISRPFAVTVILADAIFLATLIIGFRTAVNRVIGGAQLRIVLHWIYVANIGIFYFIIREIGKTVSLFLMSKRARIYFFSFWNIIDVLAVTLALVSTVGMRYHFNVLDLGIQDTVALRGLLAITTGFLWLRVLSLLKAINMQLATFVLAILQITKDIIWFCVILATLVVSFSQMFYTLLAPPSCATGGKESMECQPTEYLLRVYTVLLGDFGNFEREQFTTEFSVFLVVLYSFLVTVVLLNVLIAIASDSYEKCLLRSQSLFGRARVMLVAELVSFQYLLTKNDRHEVSQRNKVLYSRWLSSGRWLQKWSRGSILFFVLSFVLILSWTIAELVGYSKGERYSNIYFSLLSVFVNVSLFAAIMLFLASATDQKYSSSEKKVTSESFIQRNMLRLLGASKDSEKRDDFEWQGRVHHLQCEMKRISEEQKATAAQQAKAVENLVNQAEFRLKVELEGMQERFTSLQKSIIDEVHGTRGVNENITDAIKDLKAILDKAKAPTLP